MSSYLDWRGAGVGLLVETTVLAVDRGPWVIVATLAVVMLVLMALVSGRLVRGATGGWAGGPGDVKSPSLGSVCHDAGSAA